MHQGAGKTKTMMVAVLVCGVGGGDHFEEHVDDVEFLYWIGLEWEEQRAMKMLERAT